MPPHETSLSSQTLLRQTGSHECQRETEWTEALLECCMSARDTLLVLELIKEVLASYPCTPCHGDPLLPYAFVHCVQRLQRSLDTNCSDVQSRRMRETISDRAECRRLIGRTGRTATFYRRDNTKGRTKALFIGPKGDPGPVEARSHTARAPSYNRIQLRIC